MKALGYSLPFLAGLALALLLLALGSAHPDRAIAAFLLAPFSNSFYLGNLLDQASLFLACALGFLAGMRMGVFNLGGEGQAYLGAIVSLELGLSTAGLPPLLGVPLALLAGSAVAGLLGVLAGVVRKFLGINELITSFLLSCAILPLVDFAVAGPLRDTGGSLLATPPVPDAWQLPGLLPPSTLNAGILVLPFLSAGLLFLFRRTRTGFDARLATDSPEFALSQGVPIAGLAILGLGLSGGLHGLAGGLAVYGSYHAVYAGLTAGLGWNGIAAALIGRSSPLGAVLGSFLFAWLGTGAQATMIHTDFTFELSGLIQGVVFLLITMQSLPRSRRSREAWN
jgi:simple sugar transport system permease protein